MLLHMTKAQTINYINRNLETVLLIGSDRDVSKPSQMRFFADISTRGGSFLVHVRNLLFFSLLASSVQLLQCAVSTKVHGPNDLQLLLVFCTLQQQQNKINGIIFLICFYNKIVQSHNIIIMKWLWQNEMM